MLVAPRLRMARLLAGEAVAELAEAARGVLLPYPRDLERYIKRYVSGAIRWVELLRAVEGSGLPYAGSWEWVEEPLLRRLRSLWERGFRLAVRCYGPSVGEEAERVAELLRQILRVRLRGEVDLEEWKRVLSGGRPVPLEEGFVTLSSKPVKGAAVVEAWRYPPPPTEALSANSVSPEAVKRYVNYIFDFIIPSGSLDEAYLRWLESQPGWRGAARRLRILAKKLGILKA